MFLTHSSDSCKNVRLTLNGRVLTNVLEICKSENLTLIVLFACVSQLFSVLSIADQYAHLDPAGRHVSQSPHRVLTTRALQAASVGLCRRSHTQLRGWPQYAFLLMNCIR